MADNRLLAGGIPGILLVPALSLPLSTIVAPFSLPASTALIAVVENNEVRDHLRKPVGVGIRVGAIGVGAPNVVGRTRVDIRDNSLINNNFGIIVEAAFPVANSLLSTFRLTLDSAVRSDDAWFSHPTGFGNTLVVNNEVMANGARTAYDAARTCAPLP